MDRRGHILLTVAVGFAAITAPIGAQAPVERDSAGIRIIENPSRATAPLVFRLGAQTLDIGGPADNPDDEFTPKTLSGIGALRLSDATLAVTDVTRIRFVDARGRRIGSMGRSGAGPEEFRSLFELCRTRGDTVVVGDYRNGRFAVVHGQRVVRTTRYAQAFGSEVAGCFDDGTLLLTTGVWGTAPTYSIQLHRLRLDGTVVKAFGDFVFRTPSAVAHQVIPTIRSWGQRVYVGDGATSEIRVYRTDGRLTQIIRTADPAKRITTADIERELRGSPPGRPAQWHPDSYPTYVRFHVDPEGRLWVQDFAAQIGDHVTYAAIDVNGRLIGRLEVPRKMEGHFTDVVSFGVNEVQMRRTDEDGFVHLTFYPITRVQR